MKLMTYATTGFRAYAPENGEQALPVMDRPWRSQKLVNIHIGETTEGDEIIAAVSRDGFYIIKVEG